MSWVCKCWNSNDLPASINLMLDEFCRKVGLIGDAHGVGVLGLD